MLSREWLRAPEKALISPRNHIDGMFQMPIGVGVLLLILVQPAGALAGGDTGGHTRDTGKSDEVAAPIPSAPPPDFRPDPEKVESPFAPETNSSDTDRGLSPEIPGNIPPIPDSEWEPDFVPIMPEPKSVEDPAFMPTADPGAFSPDEFKPAPTSQRSFNGPNMPVPTSGDWIIDQGGNVIQDETIYLNGSLNITTGNLTLRNVKLYMNCIVDGQYQINISQKGSLYAYNTIITANSPIYHYKFSVFGNMTMYWCDVSEMWGDPLDYSKGGGIAIYSFGPSIFFTNISCSESNGIQLHGNSYLTMQQCNIYNNFRSGLATFDNASGWVYKVSFENNSNHGASIIASSKIDFWDCTFTNNTKNGITIWSYSSSAFLNCNVLKNKAYGIYVRGWSKATFLKCNSSYNNLSGISVLENSTTAFTECISTNNGQTGFAIYDDSQPRFVNCFASFNKESGIQISGRTNASMENCVSANNSKTGITLWGTTVSTLFGCRSEFNNEHGIGLIDSSRASLIECISKGNGQTGISIVSTSSSNLTRCNSIGNSGDGIRISASAQPTLINCNSTWNGGCGIKMLLQSSTNLRDCNFFFNLLGGMSVENDASASVDRLTLMDNGRQNIYTSSSSEVFVNDSLLSGGAPYDILLVSRSRLTFLNTTFNGLANVTGNAQFKVRWYLSLSVQSHNNSYVPDAEVGYTARNWSGSEKALRTGSNGATNKFIITEYIQNSSSSPYETTYYTPLDFFIQKDKESNTTRNILVSSSKLVPLFLDFTPTIKDPLEINVKQGKPKYHQFNESDLMDPDDRVWTLHFRVNKDYVSVDNASQSLTINCTEPMLWDIITITVSDGLKESNQTLFICITPANTPPITKHIPDINITEDETLIFCCRDYFNDSEWGRYLNYSINVGNNTNLSWDPMGYIYWTPVEGDSSIKNVIITASDEDFSTCSNPFNITVIPVNSPPEYTGGLTGANVTEYNTWSRDLNKYFKDEEDSAGLIYTSNCFEIDVNPITHVAKWKPPSSYNYSIQVQFTAHDAQNYSMTCISDNITLSYYLVDHPPKVRGTIPPGFVRPGETWNLPLDSFFFDEDSPNLTFLTSCPDLINIIEFNSTAHVALWKTNQSSTKLQNVTFTVVDGSNQCATSNPFDIMIFPTEPDIYIPPFPWYLLLLLPIGIISGIMAIQSYRKIKYGRYEIEQLFLIYNDGRLLAHRQKKDTAQVSNDILTGMLTALKGFIKESLRDQSQGELDEMKYGNLKIALEQGQNVYLAAFISGYVTDRLKAEMNAALQLVERDFEPVLRSWDGMMLSVEGAGKYLDELINTRGH
jgi:hypothetical protein